ncbi:MAG: DNA polymerase III subunit beta [Dictyoglomus sp.]|nr:DNA polymerase III subunit beta [Dictyoglomus sp.]MCX7942194.1 DNA polymerase III subunit beta [Dictyoglomaceae bacterium]MDW8188657.1 DNA polymerase III subunit beta [Dictyoglomus sp.]
MKFITQQEDLSDALQIVKTAIATKTTLPILTYVYLKAENDNLYLQSNNLEIGLSLSMPVIVEEPGEVCLPGSLFVDIVNKLPSVSLEFSVNERNRAIIHAGYSNVEIQGENTEEFPKLDLGNIQPQIYLNREEFLKGIKQTIFAAAEDEIKQVLTGVLMESKDRFIYIVAVDGHRLALTKISSSSEIPSVIIPAKSLKEFQRIISKIKTEEIGVAFLDSQILLKCESVYFTSRLLQGQFPSYDKIIPTDFLTGFRCNREDLLDVLERMEVLASADQTNTVKITISSQEVVLSSLTSERGAGREVIPAEILKGEESLEIGFNVEYLIEPLENLDSEEIELRFTSNLGPALIKIPEDESYIYVLMPVRL